MNGQDSFLMVTPQLFYAASVLRSAFAHHNLSFAVCHLLGPSKTTLIFLYMAKVVGFGTVRLSAKLMGIWLSVYKQVPPSSANYTF